jgi:hypothetical protein
MATFGGSNTVTDGLVLWLDAANRKSYPGSGTSWLDLSGNNNTGTLTNGPTFSSANNGSIVFDGVDDYVQLSNPTFTNQMTAEIFIKIDTSNIIEPTVASYVLGRESAYRMIASTTGFSWVCATTNNGWYTAGTAIGIEMPINNIWNHFVGTYDGTKNSLYVNGSLIVTGSAISGNIPLPGSTLQLMNSTAANVVDCKGTLAVTRMYNKALSAQEVRQNYDALKSRYLNIY